MPNAAGIIYQDEAGAVLLLKRAEKSTNGGCWGLPAGGIEVGETAEQCARREFREECGVECETPLVFVGEKNGFSLFRTTGARVVPVLNDEHTDYVWADITSMPAPLHPGLADQLTEKEAMDYAESQREVDVNGFVTIPRNPISRAGVFQYSGRQLPGGDPEKIYGVLRPAEELSSKETLDSFKLLPIIDEHVMLGDGYPTAPEEKGVHGSTGEDVVFEGRDVLAPLRIFSRAMKRMIDFKKGLSLGYRCQYEKSSGVFDGMPYDYIQRNIRGNHLALVTEGRVGTEVLDHSMAFDHFDLALDKGEEVMADKETENKETEAKDTDEAAADTGSEKKEMSLTEITQALTTLMPFMAQVQEFMAAAGKSATDAECLDEDEDKEKEKPGDTKEEAMDAAEISKLKTRLETLEKRNSKDVIALVREVTPVVGTFDSADMTADDVAAYAVKKLGINAPAGQEQAALAGYLAAHKKSSVAYAMDSKTVKADGLLAKRINGAA